MGPNYYDRSGAPIDQRRWVELREDPSYFRVALDEIGFYTVSTVWLGLDHNLAEGGAPLIFETMVFLSGSAEDTYCHRYPSEAEAGAGHEAVCAEIRVREMSEETAETAAEPADETKPD